MGVLVPGLTYEYQGTSLTGTTTTDCLTVGSGKASDCIWVEVVRVTVANPTGGALAAAILYIWDGTTERTVVPASLRPAQHDGKPRIRIQPLGPPRNRTRDPGQGGERASRPRQFRQGRDPRRRRASHRPRHRQDNGDQSTMSGRGAPRCRPTMPRPMHPVNWAEGQDPATVNNSARGMMAAIAKMTDVQSGNVTVGGSTANAITITTGQTISAGHQALGFRICFKAAATNTGATTVAVDGLTAVAIQRPNGDALSAGDIVTGGLLRHRLRRHQLQTARPQRRRTYGDFAVRQQYLDRQQRLQPWRSTAIGDAGRRRYPRSITGKGDDRSHCTPCRR